MTEKTDQFVFVNNKKLRCGFTTGTCAAAASKAAAEMAIKGTKVENVEIITPKGTILTLKIEDSSFEDNHGRCAVRKDGGDDIDATHDALIFSDVYLTEKEITIDGGNGVGRITRRGLDQPVGNAAINHVPRSMITEALNDVASTYGYTGGFDVVISIPDGEKLAEKTFNPRLGIEGGISVIGTSGIVEPMSEIALIKTITTEMNVRKSEGSTTLLIVPGNYGKDFSSTIDGIDENIAVKCSNFIGDALDFACEIGVDVVLIGNIGKLVKIAGGIMNTHSRNADCRMEILSANAAIAGADIDTVKRIMDCITTDDALEIIDSKGLVEETSNLLLKKMEYYMNHRTGGKIRTAAIMFSSVYGLLGKTSLADELLEIVRRENR